MKELKMKNLQEPLKRKAVEPLETIRHIREILADQDVFLTETFFESPFQDGRSYSCSLSLGDEPFLGRGFQVNGKGITPRLALASAYGEMMERLSCGVLLPSGKSLAGSRTMDVDEFVRQSPLVLMKALKVEDQAELSRFLCDAFVSRWISVSCYKNLTDGESVFLPDELIFTLCGTTGLCAGNTREEAIVQGMMEIFERYVTRKIFSMNLNPPKIPNKCFLNTRIGKTLERLGLSYTIRDCSLGKQFPVIGLELQLKNGERTFHLGAAPSPVVALERCYTEICQGNSTAVLQRFRSSSEDAGDLLYEYIKTIVSGNGQWPEAVFSKEESYPFTGFEMPDFDGDEQALEYYLSVADRWGGKLFVRDCSVLGFPAYRLYMPGASETFLHYGFTKVEYILWMKLRKRSETVLHLPMADREEFNSLAELLSELSTSDMPLVYSLFDRYREEGISLYEWQRGALPALVLAAGGKYTEASKYMQLFLDGKESQNAPLGYMSALFTYWSMLSAGSSVKSAREAVEKRHGKKIAEYCRIGKDIPALLFEEAFWPVCPHCSSCKLRSRCCHDSAVALSERLLNPV